MSKDRYQVQSLGTKEDAANITAFFLSDRSFDDTRHTPGEIEHFRNNPLRALDGDYIYRYVGCEKDGIIGVNSFMENEQRTGGYYWDYIVVHKSYRKDGIGSLLIEDMISLLRGRGARYIITYTCDLDSYLPIRRLFERHGFEVAGRMKDYYFEGEDRLVYYLKL
ncbi:GNAT family N-acetyltransferase [Paenibacillus methanolicus]|uniref:Ribosomal protein S18 acetylase RimI-like enzyme n=1 Tax=Paenibacillus methanolicus TaxID=582686 RepID=A0A5S5CIT3_9BACL|nr:GNAT family N-acetyltransferase [Paenibacillus methanolicus]TYP79660.1 ribosomal protein S18 acetylase RimI-like enzyme [Paenibacillus methanolicus]